MPRPRRQSKALVVSSLTAILILSAAVIGCGGDDSENSAGASERSNAAAESEADRSDATGPVFQSEFVEQADQICALTTAEIFQQVNIYLESKADSGSTEQELLVESIDAVFLPGFERQTDAIRQLEPPASGEDRVKAFLSASEGAIAAGMGKEFTASNLRRFGDEFNEARALARQLGLQNCIFYQQ